jgi:DNA-binding NtrC family response regulator
MNSDIVLTLRRGCFSEAKQLLDGLSSPGPEESVVSLEVSYYLGDLQKTMARGLTLQRASRDKKLEARVLRVLASAAWDRGDLEHAVTLSREAHQASLETRDSVLVCRTAADLLERTCNERAFNASLPLSSLARRAAYRSGDAHAVAFVHLVHARLEGRAGMLGPARRHLNQCLALATTDENLWLQSATFLDESHVISIGGDVDSAIDRAQRGAMLAEGIGWSKGVAAGAANLASLHLLKGNLAGARSELARASRQVFSSAAFQCALNDTAARIEVAEGNVGRAEELLRVWCEPSLGVPLWYRLKAAESLAKLLLERDRPMEALAVAESSLREAETVGLVAFAQLFRRVRLKALHQMSRQIDSRDLPFQPLDGTQTPSDIAAINAIHAMVLRRDSPDRAATLSARSRRISSLVGESLGATNDVGEFIRTESVHPPSLDAAVALLELSGHPHILGPETVALIKGAGCATAMALVVKSPAGVRIVEAVDWTPAEASAAAAVATDAIEHLALGTRGDEVWFLAIQPRRDLEGYCTFATIRKLLALALSLETYRRDEKQRAALWPADALDSDPECIWASEQMLEVLNTARRIAANPISVLITGETGTGKEMVARGIHRASDRSDRPFLPFNCAAVPRDLLESQLFGHRKGAFTGADAGFPGVIRSAAGGTLFLDEIGEIGPEMQPKLLRFLETHEIHPLGEPHPVKVDVRVIAATNASVEQLMADGRFRGDLFYRLNVMRLSLPPLRERREEIPPLVQHYVRKYADEQRKGQLTLPDDTLEYLLLFSWPGNVRQLANEVQRMVALAEPDGTLTPALLSPEIQASRRTIAATPAAEIEVRVALDQPLPVAVDMLEQVMVRRALDRTHGRVEEASRLLGISRKGLFLKRRRWGLAVSES